MTLKCEFNFIFLREWRFGIWLKKGWAYEVEQDGSLATFWLVSR